MKLRIKDIAWGITRNTGERKENEIEDITFDILKEGELSPIGPTRKVFVVERIEEGSILVRFSSKKEPVSIKIGETYTYKPMSFDGGHYFVLEVF